MLYNKKYIDLRKKEKIAEEFCKKLDCMDKYDEVIDKIKDYVRLARIYQPIWLSELYGMFTPNNMDMFKTKINITKSLDFELVKYLENYIKEPNNV